MPLYIIPSETFLAHRAVILPRLRSQGAFDQIHLRPGVSRVDFEIACADAVVAFQLSRVRERALAARLLASEERAYRRIARTQIVEGSPRGPIRKAILEFLEERDLLLDRRRRYRLRGRPPMTAGTRQFLIADLFGLYRCLADPLRPNRQTYFSYHLPRMLMVALPTQDPPQGESLWQLLKPAGGVRVADSIGLTRIRMYPRLEHFASPEVRTSHRYRRRKTLLARRHTI